MWSFIFGETWLCMYNYICKLYRRCYRTGNIFFYLIWPKVFGVHTSILADLLPMWILITLLIMLGVLQVSVVRLTLKRKGVKTAVLVCLELVSRFVGQKYKIYNGIWKVISLIVAKLHCLFVIIGMFASFYFIIYIWILDVGKYTLFAWSARIWCSNWAISL